MTARGRRTSGRVPGAAAGAIDITGSDPLRGFGVTISYVGDRVVIGVWGEVDIESAPELAALVDAVIDRGHYSVVLDLAELAFMDAAGLRVIAQGAGRLGPAGGELTIRSAPALVVRILFITGLNEVVRFEQPKPAVAHLGPEQSAAAPGAPVGAALPTYPRQVTAVPVDDHLVDGALRLVVALAHATVAGAHGASVSLQRHGRLTTVAATDQTVFDMDIDQYATGEGPCVDASLKGRWFHVASLDHEARWPAFTPKARQLGINAILSNPLMAGDRPIGALNIYSRSTGAFSPQEQELASMFAAEASVILSDAGADVSDDQLSRRLAEAQRTRQVIALAQGVVMERQGLSEDDAYTWLRSSSQRTNRPVSQGAADVVGSAGRPRHGLPEDSEGKPPTTS